MRTGLRFRHRIGLLVALALAGLLTVTVVTVINGRHSERELAGIETRYVPLVELQRDVETLFPRITKALEDAASAAEESRLSDADAHVASLRELLGHAHATIAHNGADAVELIAKLDAYYAVARPIASALILGANPAELGDRLEAMRVRQLELAEHLEGATRPDRNRLAAAFAAARASQRRALWIHIGVVASVFVLMVWLSLRMIRRMNAALRAVSAGVERLAEGEFGQEIEVMSDDEIGDLAREANRTAVRLREYRDQLEARNAALARASQYKSDFLASMSHELRTPLNSIMILSKVLAENEPATLTPKQVEFATTIHRSGQELLAQINEVLDLAKIEAGKQSIELGELTIAELVDYMQRLFQPVAAHKGVSFEIDVARDMPPSVRTDQMRIAQIVKNLLSNAFKFTERGFVRVRIARASETFASRYPAVREPFAIEVSDTGIGIPPDKLGAIFEAFTQAESGTSRKYGGTGLGLTIAKQLAALLGGDLVVESTLASGSTFTLVLPVRGPAHGDAPSPAADTPRPAPLVDAAAPTAPAPLPAPAPSAVAPPDPVATEPAPPDPVPADPAPPARAPLPEVPELAGRCVLVVDDDMRNVYSLASALEERDVAVVTATDGHEALDQLAKHTSIDVVLMDVRMPGLDGPQTITAIRAQPRYRTLPIIALTANATAEEHQRCRDAGAHDFLAKPIDLAQLFELLAKLIAPAAGGDPGS